MIFPRPRVLPSFALALGSKPDPNHFPDYHHPLTEGRACSELTAPTIDLMKTIDLRFDDSDKSRCSSRMSDICEEDEIELDSAFDEFDEEPASIRGGEVVGFREHLRARFAFIRHLLSLVLAKLKHPKSRLVATKSRTNGVLDLGN